MYIKIMELFQQGKVKEAEQWQYYCVQMIGALSKFSPIPTQKAILKLLGIDLGGCRLPLKGLNEGEIQDVCNYLEQVNFFSHLQDAVSQSIA